MPYTSENLPDYVKKLPAKLRSIWLSSFNSAYKEYDDEKKAFMVANGAVKKYRESHSIDFKEDFIDGFNRLINKEKSKQTRDKDSYREDMSENIDAFLRN